MKLSYDGYIAPLVLLVLLLNLPLAASAVEPTNGCHCFRNRTFDPADKFIADDYILTTTFNSLLASEFSVSKKQIIMMKMRDGVANDELMTSLFIATKTGSDASQLLQMRKKLSWQQIIKPLIEAPVDPSSGSSLSFISSAGSAQEIAKHITELLILSRFTPSPESLTQLQEKELTAKEIILAFTLANHASIPVEKITDQFVNQGRSWSEIAHNLGLQPAETGKLLEKPVPVK